MDKNNLWREIEQLEAICYKKRETLESLKDTVGLINKLYTMDREEAYNIIAIMQSIIFSYTTNAKDDESTCDEIFAQAGKFLSKYKYRSIEERANE